MKDLPEPIRANFILSVETDELFITAGLQDRVVQVRKRLTDVAVRGCFDVGLTAVV